MKGKGGFTLIELMIVILIVGVLAAIAVPRYLSGVAAARASNAAHIIGIIHTGIKQELQDGEADADITTHVAAGDVGDVEYLGMTPVTNNDGVWTYTFTDPLITATKNATPQVGTTITFSIDTLLWGGTYIPLPHT